MPCSLFSLWLLYFIKKDYLNAEKHFERLNKISRYNLLFEDFLGNILIAWIKASENNKEDSLKFFDKVPDRYHNLKKIQNKYPFRHQKWTVRTSSFDFYH